jgi:hydroxymethylpyrimidine/phosphomethylpyrimidine kinase
MMVLVFSTIDTSSGAGLVADAREIFMSGSHPFCIPSGIAVQNNESVFEISPISIQTFKNSLECFKKTLCTNFVTKVGMICHEEQIITFKNFINQYKTFLILDTPIISTTGVQITSDFIASSIESNLFAITDLFTPNKHEIEYFGGLDRIFNHGVKKILLKSFTKSDFYKYFVCKKYPNEDFIDGYIYDTLISRTESGLNKGQIKIEKTYKKVSIKLDMQVRGTGCALSSSIAGNLARGLSLPRAILKASLRVERGIKNSYHCFGGCNFLA